MDRSRVGSPACLLPALLLLAVPGGLSIYGPQGVSGPAGGLVTIRCRYGLGWEDYVKWWCRGQHWGSCNILVSTDRSEQKMKTGRVSIQDDQARLEVKVTMEQLRTEDEDFYWCGIQKSGTDLGHLVHVSVYAASTHPPEPEGRFTTPAVTHTTPPVTTDATTPGMTEALSLESAEAPEANTSAVPEPPDTWSANNSSLPLSGPLTRERGTWGTLDAPASTLPKAVWRAGVVLSPESRMQKSQQR
ncbi:CMRF35-like molecule 7 isoform X2 [Talpa occidentalis]|uniref:CMRF35-like molecule 7 isoform X2 n=1 Tax=Talpa occidentalis TaxID=50954 RepID=UPI0023F86679|nr:CMRF35-like molecule 7 isoform X2 [Talpa occidentalis]